MTVPTATPHSKGADQDASDAVQTVLFDKRFTTRIVGMKPNRHVTLRARMPLDGRLWESRTVFRSDADGIVDIASQRPIEGEYRGVDPMGPFWSMRQTTGEDAAENEYVRETTAILTAIIEGEIFGATQVNRVFAAPGVTRASVRENGLVAEFYRPAGVGPHPTLIRVGGSGGGFSGRKSAALLASHGFAVLNVAYFGIEGLPDTLERIPLEYFEKAIGWLRARESVIDDPLGVVGGSRGGELALLLGVQFPAIRTVIASVPSGVVFPGIPQDFGASGEPPKPAWTLDGEAVPYVPYSFSARMLLRQGWRAVRGQTAGVRSYVLRRAERCGPGDDRSGDDPGRRDRRAGIAGFRRRRPDVAVVTTRGDRERAARSARLSPPPRPPLLRRYRTRDNHPVSADARAGTFPGVRNFVRVRWNSRRICGRRRRFVDPNTGVSRNGTSQLNSSSEEIDSPDFDHRRS